MSEPLLTTEDVFGHLSFIRRKKQEYFICLSLDGGRRLIARRIVTIGLLDVVLAHPREVFAKPITDRAASVIVAHNHPSGDVQPSRQDIRLTQQLVAAGQILGIVLYDHIIVTDQQRYSFRQNSMICE